MACIQYSVSPNDRKEWLARLEYRTAGPYLDLDMALRVAIDDAQRVRRAGRDAHIIVTNADRTIAAVYRLCSRCTCDLSAITDNQIEVKTSKTADVVSAGV